jgi:hypothetical protein
MNRLIAALAVLSLAPVALAQQGSTPPAAPAEAAPPAAPPAAPAAPAQAPRPAAPAEAPRAAAPAAAPASPADGVDVAAVQGKVDALGEQVSELKTAVDAMRRLKLSGYVQARWAWQETPANYYNATPDTAPAQQNLFIRRARFKALYDADWSQYAVQLDATTRGVLVKEAYATLKLPMKLAIDAGLQLFPFGYEVLVRSSSDLDLLERSRVTRYFLSGEYDLGVALRGVYGPVNFKVGLFNGNGVDAWSFASPSAGLDNDQLKDVIGRIGLDLGAVTGGVSGWYGHTIDHGTLEDTKHDRFRWGADLQVYLDLLPLGGTAVKGEYIWGRTGIGTANNGAGVNLDQTGHGWYALVTQNVGPWNQLAARYEQFTPNNALDVTAPTSTTVKTQEELQLAIHTFVGGNYKLSGAWYHPMNGKKGAAAPSDPKADQWLVQAQAKF